MTILVSANVASFSHRSFMADLCFEVVVVGFETCSFGTKALALDYFDTVYSHKTTVANFARSHGIHSQFAIKNRYLAFV